MENKDIIVSLTLNLDQVNGILAALGQGPYVQVAELVELVRDQVGSQLAELQAQLAAQQPEELEESKEGEIVD